MNRNCSHVMVTALVPWVAGVPPGTTKGIPFLENESLDCFLLRNGVPEKMFNLLSITDSFGNKLPLHHVLSPGEKLQIHSLICGG